MSTAPESPAALRECWMAAWPAALAAWSRFTRLRPPTFCLHADEAKREGLTGFFAMIRLVDQAIIVSLPEVLACGVSGFPLEILAHEIGHHVLAPATLTDHGRMISRMRWALPTVEHHAPTVANLYTDLLINDRLQRSAGLREDGVYRAIAATRSGRGKGGAVWALYLRIYENLWSLPRRSLGGGATDDRIEGDALLGARVVRAYARDWLKGSGRFAALLLPHLLEDEHSQPILDVLLDTRHAAAGGEPAGLSEGEPGEREGAIHPAQDPELADEPAEAPAPAAPPADAAANVPHAGGQQRQPFEYGEILRAAGLDLSHHDAAIRFYRERALPHLVPFPSRERPRGADPLPEGLERWDIGEPLENADWLGSVLASPRIIPGFTTVQRVWGATEDLPPTREPLDLDLYVDSSGSMQNPQQLISFPALAGAILCLSALRAGARVQATLWSGKHQFNGTGGFVRDERELLAVLTGYFGGGTAFPIHRLRDTFAERRGDARPAHILVISDDGVSTMWDQDERGASGWDVCVAALRKARGGGTLVLNLPEDWERHAASHEPMRAIARGRDEQGWNVHVVTTWDHLVAFAREWSRRKYGAPPRPVSETKAAPRAL